ncbi:hypothetical protein SPI_03084 [Niveomyces insectorum RCEF 264]|uniref:Uncharacterized protein n=1 Tax=Niveomyces insectorum RCEF 264 TaxID=1081102 RepID=A0A167X221_9HYPO|nr:hypothetical protein SPI_03084 [Niveomyces insectorum RCEF 264]
MNSTPSAAVPTTLRAPPALDAYTPLDEHESRTPVSFYSGPPVLHYYGKGARAYARKEQQEKLPWWGGVTAAATAAEEPASERPVLGDDMVEEIVDIFVGSDTLVLYSHRAGCGIALPYPVIGLHAVKSAYTTDGRRIPMIYMQLELAGPSAGEADEPETVELTLAPAESPASLPAPAAAEPAEAAPAAPTPSISEASKLFDAISACADLHPDRFGDDRDGDGEDDGYPSFFRQGANGGEDDDDDGEGYGDEEAYDKYDEEDDGILIEGGDGGATLEPIEGFRGVFRRRGDGGAAASATTTTSTTGLPPPMPGSGGWITAENAHEYFDEEGNWRGRGGRLGEGAGRVRGRDEVEAGEAEAESGAGRANAESTAAAATTTATTSATNTQDGGAPPAARNGASFGEGGGAALNGADGAESKRLRTD